MNCQLCQNEIDAYREGSLPESIRILVETHLGVCIECAESYRLIRLADKVMDEEKGIQSNPFLSTRIMAGIEELEQKRGYQRIPVYHKVLKSVLISVSIAAAIFIGVVAGNIYKPTQPVNKLPVEMAYVNDAALESVDLFSNE